MKRILLLNTLILLSMTAAFADIPRPEPAKTPKQVKGIDTTLQISLRSDAKEAKLLIPKSQIKQLRAELEQLDNDSDNTASANTTINFTRVQTIVSGVFLSLAFVFGGMWFARSGRAATRSGKAFIALAVIAGLGSAATFVFANAGPPPEARSITGKMFSPTIQMWRSGSGKIRIETKDSGDWIELVVPDPIAKKTNDE